VLDVVDVVDVVDVDVGDVGGGFGTSLAFLMSVLARLWILLLVEVYPLQMRTKKK
jgi:hypothetical protein